MPRINDLGSADALLARLIKLTSRQEDFLTECFAAVLQADSRALRDYWRTLTASLRKSVRDRLPTSVATQCAFGGRTARCDMVLTAGITIVAVEHKLKAAQGKDQLPRYLALPRSEVSHVAFVTADFQQVSQKVLRARNYVRPSFGQDHFLWADFHSVLVKSADRDYEVAQATLGLFNRLGLQPAHRLIGNLGTKDREKRMQLDAKLYHHLRPLLQSLKRSKRWDYVQSSVRKDRTSEIFAGRDDSSGLRQLWLDPFGNPGCLRIRLKSVYRRDRDSILAALESGRTQIPNGRSLAFVTNERTRYKQNFPYAVEIRVPWRTLLGSAGRDAMAGRIKRQVLGITAVAESAR